MNRRAASHNVPKELMLEVFPTTTVDISLNYPDIHYANNRLHREEVILVLEIAPEIVHFHFPGYLIFLRTTTSFKIWPRNVLHPATISKKSNPAKRSDVSVLPASISERRRGNSMQQLSGANTSPINIYGKRLLTLDLNLRRIFRWPFLIASVSVPIIGTDFLYDFNISLDLRNRKSIDNTTKLSTNFKLISPEVHSIKLVSGESIFHVVLKEYPEIIKPPSFSQKVKHNVKHFIETTGPPVFAKARRLAPDRVKIEKS
ncbi:transposon Ty3-I Gag-Pol polyprotein [Nephila pilipes]|uniref:Transposon Ty3-I Gag-Pol polyprotein n=1 Tax=Nephila pilipes TaxID=299642 RepID=A0A8X6MEJ2_NEPPI|nr:transposon Ty3-I Gag-Pol polyprotein [Nephila pilipes]